MMWIDLVILLIDCYEKEKLSSEMKKGYTQVQFHQRKFQPVILPKSQRNLGRHAVSILTVYIKIDLKVRVKGKERVVQWNETEIDLKDRFKGKERAVQQDEKKIDLNEIVKGKERVVQRDEIKINLWDIIKGKERVVQWDEIKTDLKDRIREKE